VECEAAPTRVVGDSYSRLAAALAPERV
jgi:hypothetical protein